MKYHKKNHCKKQKINESTGNNNLYKKLTVPLFKERQVRGGGKSRWSNNEAMGG